jgi:Tol biopolymer transport system component
MLTGVQLFRGETISDTLAAVLKTEPDWSALPPETPPPVRRLLRRCLERDRKKRLRDIGDAVAEIDEALTGASVEQAPQPAPRTHMLPWAVAAVLAAGFLTLGLVHFREAPPEERLLKLTIQPPAKTNFGYSAISPDGRLLAFTANGSGSAQLWVRRLDFNTSQSLAGTEGATSPFWSPDSRMIGFFAENKLKKVEASGGPVQTLCVVGAGYGGTWNREGVIVFTASVISPLSTVAAAGGERKPLTSLDASRQESNHRWPWFLPDGRHFLYSIQSARPENSGIFIQSLDSKDRTRLVSDVSPAVFANGYLLFTRGGTLMAQRVDDPTLRLMGEAFPIADRVGTVGTIGSPAYSVSQNGLLVYDPTGLGDATQWIWFDRTGKRLEAIGEPGHHIRAQISPDEKKVVVDLLESKTGTCDLWLIELARGGISSRFTFDPSLNLSPVWSPDGTRVAFASNRTGTSDIYEKASSGAGKEELLLHSDLTKLPTDWSPDGRFLLYTQTGGKTNQDIWVLSLPEKKPAPFLQTEFVERDGSFSPDGKWIAYTSDESGREEIYVQTFPASGGKWQISDGGGSRARWRRDGTELFYLAPDGRIMAVEVTAGATIQRSAPQPLFTTRINHPHARFAVSANGQRFLVPTPSGEADSLPLNVVVNWTKAIRP